MWFTLFKLVKTAVLVYTPLHQLSNI